MSGTAWRVLSTEILRGAAPMAAVAIAATGIAVMFSDPAGWAGQWKPLADEFRSQLAFLMAFSTAAAAWQAGREQRRRAVELARSAGRPQAHAILVTWVSVTSGAFAGGLTMWLAGVAVVAPVATYSGRGWGLTLLVGFIALAAASAVGVTIGRLVSFRLAAPLAGIAVFAVITGMSEAQGRLSVLAPDFLYPESFTYVPASFSFRQALWLLAVAAAALVFVVPGRRWLAVVPATVVVIVTLTTNADPQYDPRLPDHAARELVCADGEQDVCLTRPYAFLLDDITPTVREQLEHWAGVPGGFERAVDSGHYGWDDEADGVGDAAVVSVDYLVSWNGDLNSSHESGQSADTLIANAVYQSLPNRCGSDFSEPAWRAVDVAAAWAGAEGASADVEQLTARAVEDQREWVGRFMSALRACDQDALADLHSELG